MDMLWGWRASGDWRWQLAMATGGTSGDRLAHVPDWVASPVPTGRQGVDNAEWRREKGGGVRWSSVRLMMDKAFPSMENA